MADRNIYLRIEAIEDYSPVEPDRNVIPPIQYKRDGMRNVGHMDGTIPEPERDARSLRAVVYQEYYDPDYMLPRTTKIVAADINEPVWDRRVPGAVLWAYLGDTLRIHVENGDNKPHSFHIHGIEYGIDSDGAWPMGTQAADGRRSDEICPGAAWTYTFQITSKDMIGVWPFHDHSSHDSHTSIKLGLFGALIVRKRRFRYPVPWPLPDRFREIMWERFPFPNPLPKPDPFPDLEPDRKLPIARKPLRARLNLHQEKLLQVYYEYLREWLYREHRNLAWPWWPIERRLHVPVFFHEMVSDETKPVFDSGDMEELVGTFSKVFDDAGTFDYFCQYHAIMTGTIEVVPGGPASATVNILDAPTMGFYPDSIQIGSGGAVTWNNLSVQHHSVTSRDGAAMATHCINGRAFVGNSPTVIAKTGTKIRWYVCNLDFGHDWHNFHPHNQRWSIGGENLDVRSMGPAESFIVDTVAPPTLILPDDVAAIQDAPPPEATKRTLMGDFVFHCHVHHHMMNGMIGVVRATQDVWLTPEMEQELLDQGRIQLYDNSNPIPNVEMGHCNRLGPGEWEELAIDPEVTFMHACLLKDSNKVLYWGYTRADQSRLYDPAGPSVSPPSNQPAALPGMDNDLSDIWSAGNAFLPDGRVLAHGGFAGPGGLDITQAFNSFLFDPSAGIEQWTQTSPTTDPRFYATTIILGDGKLLTLYGSASQSIEIWDPALGNWSAPIALPVSMDHHVWYPWTYLLPDGKLFIAGPHDPPQRFDWDPVGAIESFPMIAGNRSTGGEKATSVLLPLRPPNYVPIVVNIGGNTATSQQTAEMIDLSEAAPGWQALPDLNEVHAEQVNSVLLPDGHVFVAGGANLIAGGGPVELLDSLDPTSGWQRGPVMTHNRGYHSAAILLADGSILFGGDPNSGVFEHFRPGYFERPRPTITTVAPDPIGYGGTFTIQCPEADEITDVMLLRPGAVTHGFNMTQRAIYCSLTGLGAGTLDVEAPPNGNVAPPGQYLLFVVNGLRVPSEGRWIALT